MYRKAIVTFLDVLGFKALVKNRTAEEINQILSEVKRFAARDPREEDDPGYNPHVITFSDCVVRVRPIDTESNSNYPVGLAFHEILDLLHAQGELINKGVLVRGGVTFGDIFFDENAIYGPALIDAYELESQYAQHPRIVISNNLVDEIRKNPLMKSKSHTVKEELEYIDKLLRKGDDGMWFIDYIRAIESELDDPSMLVDFLTSHRSIILNGVKEFGGNKGVMLKYIWLGIYHNQMLNDAPQNWLNSYDLSRDGMMVSPVDIPEVGSIVP